jgi:hypothetical protein|tara:strand:- start:988 stop:1293 length:306 start_codon:yes stop_codon:yes gene_type:complete
VAVNTEHKNSDIVKTRISRLTTNEKTWINALHKSGLNLNEPFTAKDGANAIRLTPLTNGKPRRLFPNSVKLCYVMRKTKKFERLDILNGNRKIFWRLCNDQ